MVRYNSEDSMIRKMITRKPIFLRSSSVGSAVQYYCLYQTARLTYSATMISTP